VRSIKIKLPLLVVLGVVLFGACAMEYNSGELADASASRNVATRDFIQNWNSDTLNSTPGQRTSGRNGWTETSFNLNTGGFSARWATTGGAGSQFNNLHGIGWRTGSRTRVIGYNLGQLSHTSGTQGMTIGAFYGWTRNPMIEYYVLDNWLNHRSTPGTRLGTFTSDGGTYEVWRVNRNGHHIGGQGPFIQLKSVRTGTRPIGQNHTITFPNHVSAWQRMGQNLGSTMDYQAYIVEGWESIGSGNATVWQIR